jgi:hypothetical protein
MFTDMRKNIKKDVENYLFKLVIVIISMTTFGLSSCSKIETEPQQLSNEIKSISGGQSFGFCIGKCFQELTFVDNKMKLLVLERGNRGSNEADKEYNFEEMLDAADVQKINSLLNINSFKKLNDVYGCPDCADGGSEWIEIVFANDTKKRVTFEFGNYPSEIKELATLIREKRTTFYQKNFQLN